MWLKINAVFLVLALALLPARAFANRQEPAFNLVNHPLPAAAQKLSRDAISNAITGGGVRTQWQIGPHSRGTLTGTLEVSGKPHVTVAIAYSQTTAAR